jgi:hypothetical protein
VEQQLFDGSKFYIRPMQQERTRIVGLLQRLFEQEERLHHAGFSGTVRSGEQSQRTDLDCLFGGDGLETANRDGSDGRFPRLRASNHEWASHSPPLSINSSICCWRRKAARNCEPGTKTIVNP